MAAVNGSADRVGRSFAASPTNAGTVRPFRRQWSWSGAVNPRWRIWVMAFTLAWRAERLATISTRMASTGPSCLAGPRSPAADGGTGRLDRIEGVGLTVVAAGLAVRPIDLDNLQASPPKEPGEAHPIGTGSLDTDPAHLAKLLEPGQQRPEAGGVRWEGFGPHQSSQWIECCNDVAVEMRVDTTRDAGLSFYDGHCRPYFP